MDFGKFNLSLLRTGSIHFLVEIEKILYYHIQPYFIYIIRFLKAKHQNKYYLKFFMIFFHIILKVIYLLTSLKILSII